MFPLALLGGLAAVPAQPEGGPGEWIAIPGTRAIDHSGIVVPDLDQAIAFFIDAFGAALLWKSAPVADKQVDMAAMFAAAPNSTSRLAMLRLGPNLNVELIEYEVPDDRRAMPASSDLGVGHLGFVVDDIDAAGAYLVGKGATMLEGPRTNESGPNQGQCSWFFKTPWGLVLELVQRPKHMPYERETSARLFTAD